MRRSSFSLLRCPAGCEEELYAQVYSETDGKVDSATLICTTCEAHYPLEAGIARMLPQTMLKAEDEEASRKRREMAARDAQVHSYDKMKGLALFGKIEIPVTLSQMNLHAGDVLLEAGCGTGRMTPVFAKRCKTLFAADFSFASLKVCAEKLERQGITNVDLVQADVCALPFGATLFSKTVSCQVLEHLPSPQARAQMIAEIARVTQAGGRIVISAYQHSLFTRLFGEKEGEHEGGIYYYRFSRKELRHLLAEQVNVHRMTGALVYHYLARCEKS